MESEEITSVSACSCVCEVGWDGFKYDNRNLGILCVFFVYVGSRRLFCFGFVTQQCHLL